MDVTHEIDRIEQAIADLRVEFERFFAGDRPLAPEPERGQIQSALRRLRSGNALRTLADQYRVSQLEARFNSYSDLFTRRLRDREEGSRGVRVARPAKPDPYRGVVVGERVEPEAAAALFHGLAYGPGPAPVLDLERFRSYLERQVATLRDRTGCRQVVFRVLTEDGKTKLKARPLTGERAAS